MAKMNADAVAKDLIAKIKEEEKNKDVVLYALDFGDYGWVCCHRGGSMIKRLVQALKGGDHTEDNLDLSLLDGFTKNKQVGSPSVELYAGIHELTMDEAIQGAVDDQMANYFLYVGDTIDTMSNFDYKYRQSNGLDLVHLNWFTAYKSERSKIQEEYEAVDGVNKVEITKEDMKFLATYADEYYPLSDAMQDSEGIISALEKMSRSYVGWDYFDQWQAQVEKDRAQWERDLKAAREHLNELKKKYGADRCMDIVDEHDGYSN